MFAKLKRKGTITSVASLILFLIILRFLSNVDIPYNNANHITDVNFILVALQQAKNHEVELDNRYQITAIVLHWNRLSRVQEMIQNYINSNLFKEIIVWNNNPQINLTHDQILTNNESPILIYIVNSKENLRDEAKYQACAGAQTLACFYANDGWDVYHYMKTLIASFRSDPYVLHSATNQMTYYKNMLWTFMDTRIDLHTGFSWINSGSVFLREHAQRYLQLLAIHLKSHQELFAFSDIFFSIWLNDIPSQMIVNLRPVPSNSNQMDQSFFSTEDFASFQHTSSVLAIRKLEYSLRLNESTASVTFSRKQNRRFPYCVQSPSQDDDFIFYTNVLPIDIEHIPFDIARDADRATYRNVSSDQNYTHFASYNTLKAVDGDGKTCWRPLGVVKKGDFFAIDLLSIQSDITFTFIVGHSQKLQHSLDVRISFDGVWWISHQSLKGTFHNDENMSATEFHRLVVQSRQFSPELQSFRYIAFNATYAFPESFQICDIQIIIINVKMNAT